MKKFQSVIIVNGLRLHGYHGVMEQEGVCGNEFIFDIEIEYDFAKAAIDDDIMSTVNYAEVIDIAKSVNSTPSRLIENVAYRLDRDLRKRWPDITGLRIRLAKTQPPIDADIEEVAITIVT